MEDRSSPRLIERRTRMQNSSEGHEGSNSDGIETVTVSTATMLRLDTSPAPSSAYTRRSEGSIRYEELQMRVLCPLELVGAIIGLKGENIKRLRREANAEVSIEEFVAGSDDRVMSITLHRDGPCFTSMSGGDALVAVFDSFCELDRECCTPDSSKAYATPIASDVDTAMDSNDDDFHMEEDCEMRLLVDSTQIGFIVGKNGSAIKAIMEETRACVRVMPKSELPHCAWVSDELIRVAGTHSSVVAALRMLARQLELHPPHLHRRPPLLLAHASRGDAQFMHVHGTASISMNGNSMHQHPTPTLIPSLSTFPKIPGFMTGAHLSLVETVFRLLAPTVRAGNIIGRNGDHVRRVRLETGARIKVHGAAEECEERVVAMHSMEDAGSPYCAAQDALIRCVISMTADDPASGQHRVRLLAPQVSIGAVLGKKGQTVMQLRQETGALIRVQPVEAYLACAAAEARGGGEPGGDEIIQIEGALQQCVSALRGVVTLLRGWQIRRAMSMSPRPTMAAAQLLTPTILTPPMGMHASRMVTYHPMPLPLPPAPTPSSSSMMWRYRLSNAQAGAVIGKGGHHVAQIRVMTGARLHLPGDVVITGGARVLEISGSMEACHAAHAMINQFLAMEQCLPAVPEHQSGSMSMMAYPSCSTSPAESPRQRLSHTLDVVYAA